MNFLTRLQIINRLCMAPEDGNTGGGTGGEQQTPPVKMFTQEELEIIVTQRTKRAEEKTRKEFEKAKMTEEEQKKAEQEEREEEFKRTKEERDRLLFSKTSLDIIAGSDIQLPSDVVASIPDFVIGKDEADTKVKTTKLLELIKKANAAAVEKAFPAGTTPKLPGQKTEMTLEDYNKLPYGERVKIFSSDPEIISKLK